MLDRRLVIRNLALSASRALSTGSNNVVGAVKRGQVWYLAQLSARPLPTKAATAFIVVGGGDAMCQVVFERDSPFDWARWLRTSFLGGVLVGPSMHTWFNVLARHIPGDGLKPAIARLLVDRLLFAPLFIPTYMFALMALEGRLEQLPQKLRDSYFHTVLVNWKIWFPAQFITFRYVPLQYQVLWVNAASVVWNTFLSFATHSHVEAASKPNAADQATKQPAPADGVDPPASPASPA